jgi:sterol desaturase/sphingolipid hydroxylase (fatty acid hydroxylase superfamily)
MALLVAHLPLIKVAPWFTGAIWYSGLNYLYTHRKAHLDPEWAKRHLKHHYDHHMGLDQDKNWCVTRPWTDIVLGTRVDYEYDERGRPKKQEAELAPLPAVQDGAVQAANDQEKTAA